jgi:hypothetical protein
MSRYEVINYLFSIAQITLPQIGNTPSNLRIGDYSHGLTGSAHDATAFQHTTAAQHPDFLFDGVTPETGFR